MTQEELKKRLIDIIVNTLCVAVSSRIAGEHIANHLIANGVTIREWIPVTERLPKTDARVFEGNG